MNSLILKSPKHRGNSSSQTQFASASGLSDLLGCGAVLEPSAGGMLDPIALHSKCVFKSRVWLWLILPTDNMRSTHYGISTHIWDANYGIYHGILPTSILLLGTQVQLRQVPLLRCGRGRFQCGLHWSGAGCWRSNASGSLKMESVTQFF